MNHDQPRAVSRFGNDQQYRIESAKALATVTLTLPGTPYIYMGEEIAMTNVEFGIEDYRDLEILNWYNEKIDQGANPEELMPSIHKMGRDNARTPMQWDASKNAGFTTGSPWLKVNPNYLDINVAAAKQEKEGVWAWYQSLISLRKEAKTFVYGRYESVFEESESIFAYRRTDEQGDYFVMVNLSDDEITVELPDSISSESWQKVMNNAENDDWMNLLSPWQAIIVERIA
jgi:oligo-1,6-glucosidase